MKMFDTSLFEGFSKGDNVACYDEKTRILMCFFLDERKNKLVPVPLLTRHRRPDETLYIRDDDILVVKRTDGSVDCDIESFPGIMRDSDIPADSESDEGGAD